MNQITLLELDWMEKTSYDAVSYGTALRTEKSSFFSGRKTRHTSFGRQPYHDLSFKDFFRQQFLTNTGTQQREGGV